MKATTYLLLLLGAGAAIAQASLEVIELRHATAEQVLPALRPLLEPGGVLTGQRSQLIVRTSPRNLEELRRALQTLDAPARRLVISVRFDAAGEAARSEASVDARISDRGRAFGMRTATIDGNDPEVAWQALERALDYVRTERRPYLLEAHVSRLYGHSSASGAHFVEHEVDCLARFEQKLEARGWLSAGRAAALREQYAHELLEASHRVRAEPQPDPATLLDHVFAHAKRGAGEG